MPARQNVYGSKREVRGESTTNSSGSRITVDRDAVLSSAVQAKIDLGEDHVIGLARILAQDCRNTVLTDDTSHDMATEAFVVRELEYSRAERRYVHSISDYILLGITAKFELK
jgi:hypothetical protein